MRLVALASVFLFSSAALGQQLNPPTSPEAVYSQCQIVRDNQLAGDRSTDGQCIGAVDAYLRMVVKAGSPDIVEEVAKLVVALAELAAADLSCNAFDTEIVEAIRTATTFSPDDIRNAAFLEVAATIESCEIPVTAESLPKATPS